ncbi:complex I NDUFA9 subunit family protein [Pelagibius litoralis]|uniref:Complex I NDUFA9 subunit family protein n=1 Tax=Pelagibius litoralis TaxID=374515 RepID=A0A967CAW6_9PROT|nr:complex I NDUFA9 subunit family protein [Pelagibius litoralis]NIA67948.1 complex I NDUFA9 subunit family protein [Pelagibius litoralis]
MSSGIVTVFGGSGFIGRYLVQRLAQDGWMVRLAVRHPARANFLKPLGDIGQITPLCVPVQDPEAVAAALHGADAAVNLTGLLYESGKQRFQAVHAEAAKTIAEVAAAEGLSALVQVSAIGADPSAQAAYARTKGEGEAAVLQAFPQATILRPSVVFGPEDGFFNRFAEMARFAPALPLIGGGKTRFQPVYVDDVARAAALALKDPACRGKVYELGGPKTYSFKQLLELLMKTTGRRRMLVNLPFGIARLQAAFLELLPVPPLTRDQVTLLRSDNVVSEGALTLQDLGIEATTVESIIPTYLDQYRVGGRFADRKLF